MNRVMRKPVFHTCEINGPDPLRGNPAADLRLSFHYMDSATPLLKVRVLNRNLKPLTIFCDCTARFVSDLVGHPKQGFFITRLKLSCFRHYEIPFQWFRSQNETKDV